MRIEEKFNVRKCNIVEVQPPQINADCWAPRPAADRTALGVKAIFFRLPGDPDRSTLAMHMTPHEALALAARLVDAAARALK